MSKNDFHEGDAREIWNHVKRVHKPSDNVHFSAWGTVEAFARNVATISPEAWNREAFGTAHNSWRGTRSMDEAQDLAQNGWREGGEKAMKLRELIRTRAPRPDRMVKFAVAGARPHIARAIAGNPAHMRRMAPANARRKPIVTLISNLGDNSGVEAEELIRRAACVTAIVDQMESAGYSCHLITSIVSHNSASQGFHVAVTAKAPGALPDIERLAFALGHPSMLRRLTLGTIGNAPFSEPMGDGFGSPMKPISDPDNAVYVVPNVGGSGGAFRFDDDAATRGMAYLVNSLVEQGCPGLDEMVAQAA